MGSSMLIGFNNDVEFKGRMFHIQTEDHGIKDGHITTILFFSGQILDSKKISYAGDIEGVSDDEARKKAIKKRMVDLHREFYKRLFDGTYEEKVAQLDKKDGDGGPPSSSSSVPKVKKSSTETPGVSRSSSATLKPVSRPRKGATSVRKGPPPLRVSARSSPAMPKPSATPAPTVNARGKAYHPAFRGLMWPTQDLRIDGLVAEFLESQG